MHAENMEEEEWTTIHDPSQPPSRLSEQQLNELVDYLSEEIYESDFSLEEQERMREEFLQFISSTHYTCVETTAGKLYLAYKGNTLQFISQEDEATFLRKAEAFLGTRPLPDEDKYLPIEMITQVKTAVEQHAVYEGELDLSRLTPFQKEVLKHVQYVPPGDLYSYAALAHTIERPEAAGAVAKAAIHNPFPVIIPSHRIVGADGRLGNYCSGGVATKKRLLEREGVTVRGDYADMPEKDDELARAATNKMTLWPLQEQHDALQNYLEWLINRYQYIDTQEAFPGVDLVQFTEIYSPLPFSVSSTPPNKILDGQGAQSRLDEQEEGKMGRERGLVDGVQRHHYIVVLGEPGSGKTTVLRHLALTYARQVQMELRHGYKYGRQLLPIPLQLVDYVQSGMLVGDLLRDFLVTYFERHGCQTTGLAELLETAFDTGHCLVLLDGLDEVGTMQDQIKLVRQINHFVSHYSHPDNRYVVTSRITGYYQYLAKPFIYCTIRGMDYEKVDQFLQRWIDVMETGRDFASKWPPGFFSSSLRREKQQLKTTLQRLVRITHSRITYRNDASYQSCRSITPLLVQVVVIIYYTLVQQKNLSFELNQCMIDIADESDTYQGRQHPYSGHDYLVSLFSEEIYKHYLDRHIKNCDKEIDDEQESIERSHFSENNRSRYWSYDTIEWGADKRYSHEHPSTAVEDIIRFLFKNLDESTKTSVIDLYTRVLTQAYNIIAQSRGVMATAC